MGLVARRHAPHNQRGEWLEPSEVDGRLSGRRGNAQTPEGWHDPTRDVASGARVRSAAASAPGPRSHSASMVGSCLVGGDRDPVSLRGGLGTLLTYPMVAPGSALRARSRPALRRARSLLRHSARRAAAGGLLVI